MYLTIPSLCLQELVHSYPSTKPLPSNATLPLSNGIQQGQNVSGSFGYILKIYLWKSRSIFSFGHIAMELKDGTFISFWPNKQVGKSIPKKQREAKYFSSLEDEIFQTPGIFYPPSHTLYLSSFNQTAIAQWFKAFKEKDPDWHVLFNSCSSTVFSGLCVGSEKFWTAHITTCNYPYFTTPMWVHDTAMAFSEKMNDKVH